MKLAIYIDTENKNDIKELLNIHRALTDKTSKEELKRMIVEVVKGAKS